MNKNTCPAIFFIILAVTISLTVFFCLFCKKSPNGASIAPSENSVILNKAIILSSDRGTLIEGQSVQFLSKDTGMYEAAIADGVCTEESVLNATCLNGLFYIRDGGYRLSLPVSKGATIERLDYKQDDVGLGNTVVQTMNDFLEAKERLPYLIRMKILNGEVVRIEEIYVP